MEPKPKHCAKCGSEIKDREQGFKYGVVNISEKHRDTKIRTTGWTAVTGGAIPKMTEYEVTKSHNMRSQVMLCMECAEKFVDVINDFVGG